MTEREGGGRSGGPRNARNPKPEIRNKLEFKRRNDGKKCEDVKCEDVKGRRAAPEHDGPNTMSGPKRETRRSVRLVPCRCIFVFEFPTAGGDPSLRSGRRLAPSAALCFRHSVSFSDFEFLSSFGFRASNFTLRRAAVPQGDVLCGGECALSTKSETRISKEIRI
jgi:hypothetical protein